jgi:hypothetical protein
LRARHSKPCRQARVVARTGEAWPGKADERVRGHVFSGCPPAAKFLFRGLDTRLIRCWTGIPAIPYQCDCERCDARQSPWSPSIRLTRLQQRHKNSPVHRPQIDRGAQNFHSGPVQRPVTNRNTRFDKTSSAWRKQKAGAAPVAALDPAHRGAADAGGARHLFLRRLRVCPPRFLHFCPPLGRQPAVAFRVAAGGQLDARGLRAPPHRGEIPAAVARDLQRVRLGRQRRNKRRS